MALEKLTENVEVIQTLGIYPNEENGLSGTELQAKFDQGSKVIKEYLNDKVVPAHNQLLQTVEENKSADDEKIAELADVVETNRKDIDEHSVFIADNNTQIKSLADRSAGQDEQISLRSQGRSAKYTLTSSGWKRVLNIIRATNGTLQLGVSKATGGIHAVQALGINFTGNVNFSSVGIDTEPVIYQVYNHEFGDNNSEDERRHARITQVRIGYPASNTEYPESDGSVNYKTNPVNCYVDVYVDFDEESGNAQLNMNFSGFADSHNCTPIAEETNVTDTTHGMYGETLQYKEFTVKKEYTMYMPDGTIKAKEVHADNIKELEDIAITNRDDIDGLSALVVSDGERIEGLIADALHPEVKTDDMTQPVGVDENGALWTAPTGGGGASVENIQPIYSVEVTDEAGVAEIKIPFTYTDESGNTKVRKLKDLVAVITIPGGAVTTTVGLDIRYFTRMRYNGEIVSDTSFADLYYSHVCRAPSGLRVYTSSLKTSIEWIGIDKGTLPKTIYHNDDHRWTNTNWYPARVLAKDGDIYDYCRGIWILTANADKQTIPMGTKILVFGNEI